MDEVFEPAPAASPAFSLRERIVTAGITEESEIRSHLSRAHNVITLVPGVSVRRYNVAAPMSGVASG